MINTRGVATFPNCYEELRIDLFKNEFLFLRLSLNGTIKTTTIATSVDIKGGLNTFLISPHIDVSETCSLWGSY